MDQVEEALQRILKFRKERNWEQFHNPKDVALSLVLEATEVLEHFQWKSEAEIKKYAKAHKGEIGEELADVFNWILVLSHDLDIDILKAVENKVKKNELKYPVEKAKGNHKKYTEL